jgi:uncharacterized protein (TIGR02646 family)
MSLPSRVLRALSAYQTAVDDAVTEERGRPEPDVRGRVESAWRGHRTNKALEAVEQALRAMASGIERCMYCEDSRGCDVEHFRPRASHPDRMFLWPNLLWICATCNRQKNSAFDDRLIDPTDDDPFDHLVLSPSTGRLTPREGSKRGEVTLRVLPRLASDQALTRGRHLAMLKLRSFLAEYADHLAAGRTERAGEIREVVVAEPFSAVFAALLRAAAEPGARLVLGDDLIKVLSSHPEIHGWLAEADARRHSAATAAIVGTARQIRLPSRARVRRPRGD